jgi:hypothetical protein
MELYLRRCVTVDPCVPAVSKHLAVRCCKTLTLGGCGIWQSRHRLQDGSSRGIRLDEWYVMSPTPRSSRLTSCLFSRLPSRPVVLDHSHASCSRCLHKSRSLLRHWSQCRGTVDVKYVNRSPGPCDGSPQHFCSDLICTVLITVDNSRP